MPKEKNNYIFLVSTQYHLLSAIIHIYAMGLEENSIIYAKWISNDVLEIARKVKNLNLNITTVPQGNNYLDLIKCGKTDNVVYEECKEKSHSTTLVNYMWNIRHVYYGAKKLYNRCDNVIMIEEGAACYNNHTGSTVRNIFKRIAGDIYDFYEDKKVIAIYVSNPDMYPVEWKSKIKRYDIMKEWNSIRETVKDEVIRCFANDSLLDNLRNVENQGIIYTQPLSEDGFLSEPEKIDLYKQICNYYSRYGAIVIKPHPRDMTDYCNLGYIVLDRKWPSEILTLLNLKFDFAIGVCTSAIENCRSNIKINLNNSFLINKEISMIPLELKEDCVYE